MTVPPFSSRHTSSAAGGSGLRPRQMVAGLGALSLAALMAFAGPAGAAAGDPPGNNGTIKIDGVAWDSAPDNEPHPGCDFEVDFYGFDKGDYYATVTFAVQNAPGDAILAADPPRVFIGEDANDGGGSEAGLDASQHYNLYQALIAGGYEPKHQGYHIKLTVHADGVGDKAADTKHKVFWVTDCAPPPGEEIPEVIIDKDKDKDKVIEDNKVIEDKKIEVVTHTPVPEVTLPVVSGAAVPDVAVSGAGAAKPKPAKAQVLGETLSRPNTEVAPAALAKTGSSVAPYLTLAAMLLILGTATRRVARMQALNRS